MRSAVGSTLPPVPGAPDRGGIAVLVGASGRIDRQWVIPGKRALVH